MTDPLAEVVTLLQPRAPYSKLVSGSGPWRVRRTKGGQPFYCAILDGSCSLSVDGGEPTLLFPGDFVLVPAAQNFTMSSVAPAPPDDCETVPAARLDGEFRLGLQNGPPGVQLLVGHFEFGSPDAALLVSLLPQLIRVQSEKRLAALVQLIIDESRAQRPARDVILSRLLEVMLVDALRSNTGIAASPGLLRGMADERLALAIRRMHEYPKKPWTIAQLANEAAMSRSAFFDRFNRAVGAAPMEYLLAWRMALGKNMLRRKEGGVAEVAAHVGYGSASAFSVAFTRHVGMSPTRYAQEQTAPLFP
jgi:AraC-like DNA-binding protein